MPLTADRTYTWNGLKVYEYLLTNHNPYGIDMPYAKLPATPLGVTVHNTGAISVAATTTMAEQYTRATVNGNMNDVRVHFYVDDVCAWQNLPLDLSGWHAADGGGNGNMKTIAIEVVGDSAKAEANAVKLVAYLLNKYGLNVEDNLFTHTHWLNVRDGIQGNNDYLNTRKHPYKWCPIYILPHWGTFKQNCINELNKLKGGTAEPAKEMYRIRKTWADVKSQIGAYTSLENAKAALKDGYKIFNSKGEEVKLDAKPVEQKPVEQKPVQKPAETKPAEKRIDVVYQVADKAWFSPVTNCNDTDDNGYAGMEGHPITAFAIRSTEGKIKYRVHLLRGGWLSWISGYNLNDFWNGFAGFPPQQIDGIQMYLEGVDGYEIEYRVSNCNTGAYYPWVRGTADYAGEFFYPIDKVQARIVKK